MNMEFLVILSKQDIFISDCIVFIITFLFQDFRLSNQTLRMCFCSEFLQINQLRLKPPILKETRK